MRWHAALVGAVLGLVLGVYAVPGPATTSAARPTALAPTPVPSGPPTVRPPAPRRIAAPPRPRTATRPPSAPRPPARRLPAVLGRSDFLRAPGASRVVGTGALRRFTVEVEAGIGHDPRAFAAAVERTIFDRRSWLGSGRYAFQRVADGPVALRVVLASPRTTDRLCRPLRTGGIFSCFQRGRAVINVSRWQGGARAYGGDLASYRLYVVNHEVGHAFGHGHRSCPGAGRPAPTMMQQTKGVGSCRPNPWPAVA